MREERTHDLGKGFTLQEFIADDELVGYTITGPAAPQCRQSWKSRCGGLCAIKPYSAPAGEGIHKEYSVWKVSGEWPNITLHPSVMCDCGGQHSFVQDGRWV